MAKKSSKKAPAKKGMPVSLAAARNAAGVPKKKMGPLQRAQREQMC